MHPKSWTHGHRTFDLIDGVRAVCRRGQLDLLVEGQLLTRSADVDQLRNGGLEPEAQLLQRLLDGQRPASRAPRHALRANKSRGHPGGRPVTGVTWHCFAFALRGQSNRSGSDAVIRTMMNGRGSCSTHYMLPPCMCCFREAGRTRGDRLFIASASSLVRGMGAVAASAVLVSPCATQIRWPSPAETKPDPSVLT